MRKHVVIIAEAGVNHNGDYEIAKKLVDAASGAGADYVKFQTFKAHKIVSKSAKKAEYQSMNIGDNDDTQYEMLKKLEMPEQWHYDLTAYASSKNIKFLSTGFDNESIDFLDKLAIPLFKIPSGEITNKPFIIHIAKKGKPVILSTGMATLEDIKNALDILNVNGISNEMITVLHCNTEYPTPMKDVNLLAMNKIGKELGVKIGYSDHTLGIEVPIAAVALGAEVIEKHFTLDRNLEGPDHKASLEPSELKAMVSSIRNIELALGKGEKKPSESETKNIKIARKSIHLAADKKSGEIIGEDDLEMLRPGDGISPMETDNVIGRKVNKDLNKGHKLSLEDIN